MIFNTEVIVGRQSIILKSNDVRIKNNLDSVKSHLTLFETVQDPQTKRFSKVAKSQFYIYLEDGINFKFYVSINNLGEIVRLLRMSNVHETAKILNVPYALDKIDIDLNPKFVLREDQQKFSDRLLDPNTGPSNLLDIQTGFGKSIIGFITSCKLEKKIAILIKPSYLLKWIDDVNKYAVLAKEEIYVIKGRDSLDKLFNLDKKTLDNIKIYVISMRTISLYFNNAYEDKDVKIKPDDFMSYTNISTVLNDESHKEFEALFKTILWMNPYKLLGLSATMESDKPNQNFFYNLLYPRKDRLVTMTGVNKYLNVIFADYMFAKGIFLPHKTHRGYNHIMFEQAIMKNMYILKDYIDMVIHYIDKYYIDYHIGKEKCLIFFSTIDMCTIVTSKLKALYKKKVIKRYVGVDDYNDMLTGDIIITTPASTGTAIDIPGLITAIQTVCISDMQLNIQSAGRLREIKGREVKYISLQAPAIKKQDQLKQKRVTILKPKVKSIQFEKYTTIVGTKGTHNGNTTSNNKKVFKVPTRKFGYNSYYGNKRKFNPTRKY